MARFKFKSGKVCCSISQNSCKAIKQINSNNVKQTKNTEIFKEKNKNKKRTKPRKGIKVNTTKLCDYGCGNIANFKLLNKKLCCNDTHMGCKVNSKRYSESVSKESRLKHKKYMLNGGSSYANSFNKNPSKPQVELYNRVKEIYPSAILNYPILNYSIDIVIPHLKIAIESDGSYWHQDIKNDITRQTIIENFGWKFIRFKNINTIKQVPTFNQIITSISEVIK